MISAVSPHYELPLAIGNYFPQGNTPYLEALTVTAWTGDTEAPWAQFATILKAI